MLLDDVRKSSLNSHCFRETVDDECYIRHFVTTGSFVAALDDRVSQRAQSDKLWERGACAVGHQTMVWRTVFRR